MSVEGKVKEEFERVDGGREGSEKGKRTWLMKSKK
jgi:hypothetical protein